MTGPSEHFDTQAIRTQVPTGPEREHSVPLFLTSRTSRGRPWPRASRSVSAVPRSVAPPCRITVPSESTTFRSVRAG